VNFKVVKQFTNDVRERCAGAEIVGKLNPGQQVVKIVAEELTELMGGGPDEEEHTLRFAPSPPTVILMAGLQGSGKTTATAKLARYLREEHSSSVAVAACDVYRPAAVDQLVKVGAQAGAEVYEQGTDRSPVEIAKWALERAEREGKDVLIVDTSGRLHVDAELMDELVRIRDAVKPTDVLLVVDAMTGQDAVNVAQGFHDQLKISGVVLTKLDSDARGGAALSVRAVTGAPILFAGTGEKLAALEVFHPDRLASRILGMGDVLTLIEKAQQSYDQTKAKELERKFKKNEFTITDFAEQLRTLRKMGSLGDLLGMIPGLKKIAGQADSEEAKRELVRIQAIIDSMTVQERNNHLVLNGRRRARIATGSGTSVQDVNRFVKQFEQTRKMMKKFTRGSAQGMMRGLGIGR
jgi:signal recognition particle subunit SRP54